MEQKIKKKRDFYDAFKDLMKAYGFVDWALVARKVDSDTDAFWEAGTGDSVVGDRERADVLHAELARLQVSIIVATTPKTVEKEE